jgi:hypothetical protein
MATKIINVDIANNNFLIAIKTLSNIKYLDSYSEYPQIRTCLDEVLTIINQIPNPTAEQLDFKSQVFMALKDFHRNIAVQALTKNNFCNAFEHVEYAFKYLDFEDVPIGFVAYRRSFFYTLSYNPVLKKELNDLLKSARMEPLGEYSNLRRNILTLFDRVRHIVLTYQHVPPHLLNLFVTIDHATGKRTFAFEEALEALRKKTFSLFHRTDEDPNTLLSLGNRVIALEETIERQAAVIDKQGALLQQYSEQLAVQTAQLAELKRDMASFKTEKKRSQSSLLFSNNSARTFALKKRYKMYSPTTDNEAERKNAL